MASVRGGGWGARSHFLRAAMLGRRRGLLLRGGARGTMRGGNRPDMCRSAEVSRVLKALCKPVGASPGRAVKQ
jgi:hypothetical protein